MNRINFATVLVFTGFLATSIGQSAAQTYQKIDVPTSSFIFPSAVNSAGQVVGVCAPKGTLRAGFLRDKTGKVTVLKYPGSVDTFPTVISETGVIYGIYRKSDSSVHGFSRTAAGVYKTVDFPSAGQTYLLSLSPKGVVGGSADSFALLRGINQQFTIFPVSSGTASVAAINSLGDAAGTYRAGGAHGFIRTAGGTIVQFDAPSAEQTSVVGIDATGRAFGNFSFQNGRIVRPFIRTAKGKFPSVGVPQYGQTFASGMNDTGTIVGYFVDTAGKTHGYLKDNGKKFVQLDATGSTYTDVSALSVNRNVVGTYQDAAGVTHGYLATGIQ
jgi:probable HAF family extracellular repeat protein